MNRQQQDGSGPQSRDTSQAAENKFKNQVKGFVDTAKEKGEGIKKQEMSFVLGIEMASNLMMAERELDNMSVSLTAGVNDKVEFDKKYEAAKTEYDKYLTVFENLVSTQEAKSTFIAKLQSLGENELADYLARKYGIAIKEKVVSKFNPSKDGLSAQDFKTEREAVKKREFDINLKLAEDYLRYRNELDNFEAGSKLREPEADYDVREKEEMGESLIKMHDALSELHIRLKGPKSAVAFLQELRASGKDELADSMVKILYPDDDSYIMPYNNTPSDNRSSSILGSIADAFAGALKFLRRRGRK